MTSLSYEDDKPEFKTEARVAAEESAAKYDQTASNLASKYHKKDEAKGKSSHKAAQRNASDEEERSARDHCEQTSICSPSALQGSEDDEEDGPSLADRMVAGGQSIVAGAKHIPEAIQSSLQTASAAIKRKKTSDMGDKEPASPPSRVVIEADDSEEGESAATKLKEALAELGKRTREASSDLFDNLKKLAIQDRTVMTVSKRDFQQKPCPQLLLQCCTVLVCKGLTVPHVFKTSNIPPEAIKKHMLQLGSSFMVPDDMDPREAAAVIKHFLASLDDPLLCRKMKDEWVGMGADPSFVKLVLVDLPPANHATLRLLMETCSRIAAHSETTRMDAQALATELVPVLLWRSAPAGSSTQTREASASDQHANSQVGANEETRVERSKASKRSIRDEDDDLLVGYQLANTNGLDGKKNKEGGTGAHDSEEPSLSESEFEAVVRVVAHLIENFEDCFPKVEAL